MALIPFSKLPDPARLWIFGASQKLTQENLARFNSEVAAIIDQWQAHGKDLSASFDLQYGRFLFVGADEKIEQPSGCSIDSLTHSIVALGEKFGTNFRTTSIVFFRRDQEIVGVTRAEFKAMTEQGSISPETVVFNNTLTTLAELRSGKWEVPASESWHAKAFKFAQTA